MIIPIKDQNLETNGISKADIDNLCDLYKNHLLKDAKRFEDSREKFEFQLGVLKYDYNFRDVLENIGRLDVRTDFVYFAFKDNKDFTMQKAEEIAREFDALKEIILEDKNCIGWILFLTFGEQKPNPTENDSVTSE